MAILIIFGGFSAFAMFLLSVNSARKRNYRESRTFALLELLSAVISAGTWMYALKISGKADWYLFGFYRYTPLALICLSMFAAGTVCMIVSVWGLAKHKASQA